MTQATATFEAGTQGATIATSDTGSTSAWDVVTLPAGTGSLIYDNTHVYGTRAAKLTAGSTSTTAILQWSSVTLGSISDAYGRFYIWASAFPGNSNNEIQFRNTGTVRARLKINTAGKIELSNSLNSIVATSTNSIALSQWNRVEFHLTFSSSVGFFEALLFTSPDSSSATETIGTGVSNLNLGGASANEFLIGAISTQTNWTHWLDNIVWGATSYPGPFTSGALVNSVPPSVSGNFVVGSTVTASPGTWTPTPSSFTYFWHRADDAVGTNLQEISTATGATYTLDPADAAKYIQAGVIPVP